MYKIHFHPSFDDRAELEMTDRGYLSHVEVELDDGSRYPVFFYDPIRLRQDLEEMSAHGVPVIAEPGMIVVPNVTKETIRIAIERLIEEGYFEHLRPLPKQPTRVEANGVDGRIR
jgi:hypothetical protein